MDFELHYLTAITNDFSEEQKISSGAFGNVYKVCMSNDFVSPLLLK